MHEVKVLTNSINRRCATVQTRQQVSSRHCLHELGSLPIGEGLLCVPEQET